MHTYFLRAHPVCGESHNQRNTTREVATKCVVFYLNHSSEEKFFRWDGNAT